MSTPDPPPTASRDPRAAFAQLSRLMLGDQALAATLTQIAELTRATIPGVAEVSVTLLRGDRVESVAFTGPLACVLDERQYQSGFGPCMDAALSGRIIAIADTADSATYADFARAAHAEGITSTLSIGLPVQRHTIGSLNIYAGDGSAFDESAQDLAVAFAGYAAVAVANAGVYSSTAQLAVNLQHALESRAVIDQAKGILMGRLGVSADRAFDLLARQSAESGRTLRDIAAELVAEAHRPGPDPRSSNGSSSRTGDPGSGADPSRSADDADHFLRTPAADRSRR